LAITDINALLSSLENNFSDASSAFISLASVENSVVWDNTNTAAPVATITIPSTTFVLNRQLALNFVNNAVKDLAGNAIADSVRSTVTVVADQ
jgi:hypothetical protein